MIAGALMRRSLSGSAHILSWGCNDDISFRAISVLMANQIRALHDIKDLDMRIAANGDWFYQGSKIERPALVRLFSTVLRVEPDGRFFLQTPVERGEVIVEKTPFIAILMTVEGSGTDQTLRFETNVGDSVVADPAHPLSFTLDPETNEPFPVLDVRDGLTARLNRAVFYQLVDLAVEDPESGGLRVWSGGTAFSLAGLDP